MVSAAIRILCWPLAIPTIWSRGQLRRLQGRVDLRDGWSRREPTGKGRPLDG